MSKRTLKQPLEIKDRQEINTLRGEVSVIEEIFRGVKIKVRKLNKISKEDLLDEKNLWTTTTEKKLKQKIQLNAQRMKR